MARLGLWTRLGIVLSVLFMIGSTFQIVERDYEGARVFSQTMFDMCMGTADIERRSGDMEKADAATERCYRERPGNSEPPGNPWQSAIMQSAMTLLICWILIGIAIATIRWIWAGRK